MRLYRSYAEALAKRTACKFTIPWSFELPAIPPFPPALPTLDLSFSLPALPGFACPIDDAEGDR